MLIYTECCTDAAVHVTGVVEPGLPVSIYPVCKEVNACISYNSSGAPRERIVVDDEERSRYLPKDISFRVKDSIISCFRSSNGR